MNALQTLLRRFTIRLRMNGAIVMVLSLFALVGLATMAAGRHLYALNHDFMSHSIKEVRDVSFRIDPGTGSITPKGDPVEVPMASCIRWMK